MVPNGEGLIANLYGMYKGMIVNGKAQGKGVYQSVSGKNKCEGIW